MRAARTVTRRRQRRRHGTPRESAAGGRQGSCPRSLEGRGCVARTAPATGRSGSQSPGDGRCLARPLGLSILQARASRWAAAAAVWPGRFLFLAAIPGSGRVRGRTSRRILRERAPRTGIGGVVDHGARRDWQGARGHAGSVRCRCRSSSSRRRHCPRPTVACGTGSSRRSPLNRPRNGGARPLGISRKRRVGTDLRTRRAHRGSPPLRVSPHGWAGTGRSSRRQRRTLTSSRCGWLECEAGNLFLS